MIDLNFEKYTEMTLTDFQLKDSYDVQQWTHCIVRFMCDNMPEDIEDPEALVILNQENDVLQISLYEEGCDSPNYQFTDGEKKQITNWLLATIREG
ncbi:hypothetical protein [Desertibacillus haloalkaliphilus]|uniref:hypothetical protein n=1 Tax=Desertibacillus haloalkaliphilus TaxID=1328930 RepID=UPI001C25B7A2|nr:hypothetical protein [Desertibacillus haloalkaliphilus]MBU8907644.1 hypothetical protein [Desertibacillus haloalkaliphilus]